MRVRQDLFVGLISEINEKQARQSIYVRCMEFPSFVQSCNLIVFRVVRFIFLFSVFYVQCVCTLVLI